MPTPRRDDCASPRVSTGPAANLAGIELVGPKSAAAGSTVSVSATLRVRADGARIIADASRSTVLVLRAGHVVGGSTNPPAHTAVPLRLQRGRIRALQVVPDVVTLSSCASIGASAPRTPLAPGPYSFVAVLAYRSDGLNGAPDLAASRRGGQLFFLVSSPVPVIVT